MKKSGARRKKVLTNRRHAAIINVLWRDAGIAQPVEQLICNQQVGGSSPSTGSTLCYSEALRSEYGGIPEWPKGADCKSVSSAFGGSNPPSPTKKRQASLMPVVFYFFRMTVLAPGLPLASTGRLSARLRRTPHPPRCARHLPLKGNALRAAHEIATATDVASQ